MKTETLKPVFLLANKHIGPNHWTITCIKTNKRSLGKPQKIKFEIVDKNSQFFGTKYKALPSKFKLGSSPSISHFNIKYKDKIVGRLLVEPSDGEFVGYETLTINFKHPFISFDF